MRISSCLLILCIFLNTSCSKAADPAKKFSDKGYSACSKKNYKEACAWFKKSAELGDVDAMFNLGAMYAHGIGVSQDPQEAFKWSKKAAELGNASAMYSLGLMYAKGEGTLKDPQRVKYWIKKSYEAGNKDAEKAWNTLELWKY
jgi:TPR repeat protein